MIKYRVIFNLFAVAGSTIPLPELFELLNDGKTEAAKKAANIEYGEVEHLFEESQPIDARRQAFGLVEEQVKQLKAEGFTDSRFMPTSSPGIFKVFYFTIYAVWDGNAIAIGRPVNTPGIQQYRAFEYDLYKKHGYDIGAEEPATEFIAEQARSIKVIPTTKKGDEPTEKILNTKKSKP